MKIIETKLKEVKIIEMDCFGDNRGWFMETYNQKKFNDIGILTTFVQDNHSMSAQKGTLRGLHFQNDPMAQTKLLRCTKGALLDVAVDIRKNSKTYKQWIAVELTEDNKKQIYIPKGFAHGFLTLTDNTEIQYKVDNLYSPEYDRSIAYNDPSIGIKWGDITPILSDKDKKAPFLDESDANFYYE